MGLAEPGISRNVAAGKETEIMLRLHSGLLFRRWWRRRTGRSTSTIATTRLRLQIERQPHERFDRTRTQFNPADPELDAALQNVFRRRRLIAEVVRDVHPDDDAVDFRIGFVSRPRRPRQKARSRNGGECELADLTSCVLHDEPFQRKRANRVDTTERVGYTAKRLTVTPVTGYTKQKMSSQPSHAS